jgi:hypothetical protein
LRYKWIMIIGVAALFAAAHFSRQQTVPSIERRNLEVEDVEKVPYVINPSDKSGDLVTEEQVPNDESEVVVRTDDEPTSSDEQVYNARAENVVVKKEGGRWVTQGDILIDESQLKPGIGDSETAIASISEISYWEGGIIPYDVDPKMDRTNLDAAIADVNRLTKIYFVLHSGEADYVYFRLPDTSEDVCQSFLGRKGGMQETILQKTCGKGQVLHELMHTIGFVHEHSREDRDLYVNIIWDNILTPQKNQFQMLPAHISNPTGSEFDFNSVLLYPADAFTRNGEFTMTQKDGTIYSVNRSNLSALDVRRVNSLYGVKF